MTVNQAGERKRLGPRPSPRDLIRILRTSGPRRFWDHLVEVTAFDFRRGTDTDVWLPLSAYPDLPNLNHARRYQPVYTRALRHVLRVVHATWDPRLFERTFIDLGSGKGKCLIVASEMGFTALRGIEFNAYLAELAGANLARCRIAAEVLCQDVTAYDAWPDGALIYANNPFDETIMGAVRDKLEARSDILLLYTNPKHADLFGRWRFLGETTGHHSSWQTKVFFWPGPAGADANI